MAERKIAALFDSEDAASRAVEALNAAGIRDASISSDPAGPALAGAASRPLDEGRVSVTPKRGRVLLRLDVDDASIDRAREILKRHNAVELVEASDRRQPVRPEPATLSGAPADRGASAGTIPETPPMPTGSGVMDSRGDWLVEREGDLVEDVDPDAAERNRREREIKEKS